MAPLAYAAATGLDAAIASAARMEGAEFIAGGTDMLQLIEEGVRAPSALIDLNRLPISGIAVGPDGARIGALTRLSDVADDPGIRQEFPAVAQALLATASPQVRNMATIGGNLLQRTRCLYFRDVATPCNKRAPGSGCPARDGEHRINAILGGSPDCIAAYPGDLAVALLALDAEIEIVGIGGKRRLPVGELHRLPGDTPHVETTLSPGELITAVVIPPSRAARASLFLKIRDRASFEWALASAAVGIAVENGRICEARLAVGGVATKPWRLSAVERMLAGEAPRAELLRAAGARAADGAEPLAGNSFKVALLNRLVERALRLAGGLE